MDKGSKFEVLNIKECTSKSDAEACNIEPSEKARWFQVKDNKGDRFWIWENQDLESNQICNAPINNSEG